MEHKAKLFTDGGSRGNPGPAGIGGVLMLSESQEKFTFSEYIGEATNNQAEYKALLTGMELAVDKQVTELQVFMDSELIVKQLRGDYKVKNPDLKNIFAEVLKLTNKFSNINFQHIYREKNKEADALVNKALDAAS